MNWSMIITITVLVIAVINVLILRLDQLNLFSQVLYAFIYDHESWKRYRRLKKYLKTNTIPVINLLDLKNNPGFAFVQYDDCIFTIQGDDLYLGSYYNHLIKDLLKRNNHDSR